MKFARCFFDIGDKQYNSKLYMYLHCVTKEVYNLTSNDNLNRRPSCPILIFW